MANSSPPLSHTYTLLPTQYEGATMDILDIGPRARIRHIKIEAGKILAYGNATISPTPPFLVAMPEKKVVCQSVYTRVCI